MTYTVELSERDMGNIILGVSLMLHGLDNETDRWKNKKDSSMDKLFLLYSRKIEVADLWARLQVSAGADYEDVRSVFGEGE